jgi:hypothetical protein
MAQDIFLKINGIDGESQDSAHKNEIEVTNWGWRISQASNMHAGSGGGAGKATVDDLAFEHSQGPKTVQLSNLRLRLVPEKELTDAWIGLALTRVKTIRADGSIELDETLIPPVNGYGASTLLTSWLGKIHELTRMRANALAHRLRVTLPRLQTTKPFKAARKIGVSKSTSQNDRRGTFIAFGNSE